MLVTQQPSMIISIPHCMIFKIYFTNTLFELKSKGFSESQAQLPSSYANCTLHPMAFDFICNSRFCCWQPNIPKAVASYIYIYIYIYTFDSCHIPGPNILFCRLALGLSHLEGGFVSLFFHELLKHFFFVLVLREKFCGENKDLHEGRFCGNKNDGCNCRIWCTYYIFSYYNCSTLSLLIKWKYLELM